MDIDPAGPAPEDPEDPEDRKDPKDPEDPGRATRTGRNLPVAIGVGAGLGGLVFLTLFTVKATFLLYVGAAIAVA
ncbi:MAG: phosphatidate cytidylyltransferase, partial [Gemmatimonadales bacterium]